MKEILASVPVAEAAEAARRTARRSPDRWGSSAATSGSSSSGPHWSSRRSARARLPLLPRVSDGGDLHRLVALRAPRPEGVRADYRVLNPRTHVGEVLQAVYRVENRPAHEAVGRALERVDPAVSLPGASSAFRRAAGASGWPRSLTRRGSYRLGALRVAPATRSACSRARWSSGRPRASSSSPRSSSCRTGACRPHRSTARRGSRPLRGGDPLVSTVRPYVGDAINRIHWLSSAGTASSTSRSSTSSRPPTCGSSSISIAASMPASGPTRPSRRR